jgi:hypothetical protein
MEKLKQFGLKLMEIKRLHGEAAEKVKHFKGLMDRAENAILSMLKQADIRTIQVDDPEHDSKYTFSQGGGSRFNVKDMEAYLHYIKSTGDYSMITSAVRKEAVVEFRRMNKGLLPPGVEETLYDDLSVRTTRVPAQEEM